MSDKRLTVSIRDREVLPVRAIPYVTGGQRFSPDVIARRFAECDPFDRKWTLKAYSILGDVGMEVYRSEWDEVVTQVDSFEIEQKNRWYSNIAAYAVWRNGAAAALPAGWFVYLNEFEKAVQADLEDVIFYGGAPNNGRLILSPVIDLSTREMVMEGFKGFPEYNPAPAPEGPHQMQSVAQGETKANSLTEKTRAKRISQNYAFLLDCERKGIPMNIESIWLHIRENAGKHNFLFKTASKSSATTVDGKRVTKKNLDRVLRNKRNATKTSK